MSRRLRFVSLVVAATAMLGVSPVSAAPTPHANDPAPGEPNSDASATDVGTLSAPLSGIAKIVPAYDSTCALMTNGTAKCWGYNNDGELGNGNFTDSLTPVNVKGPSGSGVLSGIVDLTAGEYHTCALLADGTAKCWGYNNSGELGDGTFTDRNLPRTVKAPNGSGALSGITQLVASTDTTCARLNSGQARCWGYNLYGGIGDGTTTHRNLPRTVKPASGTGAMTNIFAVAPGYYTSCFLINGGTARCVGYNGDGELGNGTTTDSLTPVTVLNGSGVGALSGITFMESSYFNTCVALSNGQARCWGDNNDGEVGDGTSGNYRSLPRTVKNAAGTGALTGVVELTVDGYQACVRFATGTAQCWGYNYYGVIGDGTTVDRSKPRDVKNSNGVGALANITQIQTGPYSTCARLTDGTARCWGYNFEGNLGSGTAGGPVHDGWPTARVVKS